MSTPISSSNNTNSNNNANKINLEEKDYPLHKLTWTISSTGINVPVIEPLMALPLFSGRLVVNVKRAMNLYNASRIGRMDPFCEVKIGDAKRKTTIHKKGDINPIWDETLEFHLQGTEQTVRLRVYNKTLLSSTLLGTARVRLDYMLMMHGIRAEYAMSSSCVNQDSHTAWFDIGRDSRQSTPAGSVLLSVSFKFDDPNAPASMTTLHKLSRADALDTSNIILPGGRTQSVIQSPISDLNSQITPARTKKSESVIEVSMNRSSSNNPGVPLSNINSAPSTRASSPQHSRAGSFVMTDDTSKQKLFGGTLRYGVHRSKDCVPVIVYVCIQYLLYHGLNSVGIFRVSGSSELKEQIREAFEASDYVSIADPHVTADVLKTYFRQLSDPLIPSSSFDLFASITDTRNREVSIVKLREAVLGLPKDNYIVLSYLLHFLNRVAENAEINKMNRRNLALVFGPNLMRRAGTSSYAGSDAGVLANEMRQAEECILLMLEGYSTIFPEGPPRPFQLEHPTKDRPHVGSIRASTRAAPRAQTKIQF